MPGPDDLSVKYTVDKPLTPRVPENYRSRPITKVDFDRIVQVVDHWWEGPIAVLVHPMFFHEFGKYARVVEDTHRNDKFVGFLLGFIVPADGAAPACGYVHLVGVEPSYRRKGVARVLYADFGNMCATAGCKRLKAITTAGNEGSKSFHEALGWSSAEDADYAGPGRRRLVFTRQL